MFNEKLFYFCLDNNNPKKLCRAGLVQTPAPGAYSPEKVHPQGERHAPAYSMAMRTRYRKRMLLFTFLPQPLTSAICTITAQTPF